LAVHRSKIELHFRSNYVGTIHLKYTNLAGCFLVKQTRKIKLITIVLCRFGGVGEGQNEIGDAFVTLFAVILGVFFS
jgi:hypothetical protein